jgi:D-alanyl-D-alanine carboxypeptidase
MRTFVWVPMCILAGLAVFSFVVQRPEPVQPNTYVPEPAVRAAQAYLLPLANASYAPVRDTTAADPEVEANAALLYHLESGRELWSKNADLQVPIASLTKLLSAMVVEELFLPDELVTVASDSIRVDGTKQTLYADEQLSVRDLRAMMLVESSNDAAYALAAYARSLGIDFVTKMNQKAWTLGMGDCVFTDPAGLDDAAYCTADDLIRLVRAALRTEPELWPIMATPRLTVHSVDGRLAHEVISTNELLDEMPGIIGGKTGHTDAALGCLILVVKLPGKDDTLISIVLGSRARFTDTRTLVSWAQAAYRWQ